MTTKRRRAAPSPPAEPVPSLETWPAPAMPLESHPAWSAGAVEAPQEVQVMVRVDEEDYVPSCVRLRARISDVLFTAELAVSDLESLQADPHVVSVSLPRGVTPAESGGEPD